jgi:hypothetical protein
MIKKYEDLPDWIFELDEISANVYEVIGKDKSGYFIREVGTNLELILNECKRKASQWVNLSS